MCALDVPTTRLRIRISRLYIGDICEWNGVQIKRAHNKGFLVYSGSNKRSIGNGKMNLKDTIEKVVDAVLNWQTPVQMILKGFEAAA